MDAAWRLEQELWKAASSGHASDYYARHMTADAFIVLPGRLVERHEMISGWAEHEALESYELSQPRMVMVDGESMLLTYRVEAHGTWLPDYRAQVTALYTLVGTDWALAFRQHTPDGDAPFPF